MTTQDIPTIPIVLDRLLEEARLKLAIAREHVQELESFGITNDWLDQGESDIATAVSYPTFGQQRNELKSLTAAKDSKLEECVQWGRKLRFRMAIAAEEQKSLAVQFPSKDWNQAEKSESKLITLFPTLLQLARTQATALVSAGQTEADLSRGKQLLEELVAANQAQEEYNLKRTNVTAERRIAFRKLYDRVNRINKSGQMVYGVESAKGRLFRSSWTQAIATEDVEMLESLEINPSDEIDELS